MKWALVDTNEIVVNVIAYDGVSEYAVPEGLSLEEVNDWVDIGQATDVPEPTPVTPTIEQRRTVCAATLYDYRNGRMFSPIVVGGNSFGTDPQSQAVMLQAISVESFGIATVFPTTWILSDNSTAQVTLQDMKDVALALSVRTSACYANYMALLGEINASDDPESIDITQGWPS